MHNIHNFYLEELDPNIYNNLEHQNLYVLDLNCDYAINVLRQVTYVFISDINTLLIKTQAE